MENVDAPSIYDIPKVLHAEGLDVRGAAAGPAVPRRRLDRSGTTWWTGHKPKEEVVIALVGKYVDLPDAYLSVCEALRAGGFANRARVTVRWVASDTCQTPEGAARALADVDGVCVPGGFGIRGVEGKVGAVRYARENAIPILGLCLACSA